MTDELKRRVQIEIDALAPELLEIARLIHARPELAFEERYASALLCDRLEAHALSPERGAYGIETAFRCDIGAAGPEVAILSEYDALPGLGHACGHNIIAAMGFGAAVGLAKLGLRTGRIRYLGTPAEENGAGKAVLIAKGAFDGLDAAMMVHPASLDLETMPTLACTNVDVTYRGRASHASASPWDGVNALDALVAAYQAIAQLRQHIRPTERIHGIVTHGGDAPNIVPDRAEGRFFIRAADAAALETLRARVRACLQAGALSAGAMLDMRWWAHPYLDIRRNEPLSRAYRANAEALGRTFVDLAAIPPGAGGSTDMGNVSYVAPALHPLIGIAAPHVGLHTECFALCAASVEGDQATIDGAKAMAMTAIDIFTSATLRNEILARFRAT